MFKPFSRKPGQVYAMKLDSEYRFINFRQTKDDHWLVVDPLSKTITYLSEDDLNTTFVEDEVKLEQGAVNYIHNSKFTDLDETLNKCTETILDTKPMTWGELMGPYRDKPAHVCHSLLCSKGGY